MRLRSAAHNSTEVLFDNADVTVSQTPVAVHVLEEGLALNDVIIEALVGDAVRERFRLTAIAQPALRFTGRFQCRLAADRDSFDDPWGSDRSPFGMYAVSGPDLNLGRA